MKVRIARIIRTFNRLVRIVNKIIRIVTRMVNIVTLIIRIDNRIVMDSKQDSLDSHCSIITKIIICLLYFRIKWSVEQLQTFPNLATRILQLTTVIRTHNGEVLGKPWAIQGGGCRPRRDSREAGGLLKNNGDGVKAKQEGDFHGNKNRH